ncbi:MAG: YrbL family protein [Alphaproteobacteria bacterium]|nr:YrbL family protein [Alphaproteobacteria bacterium]
MLILEKFIGKGAVRLCFAHPRDAGACVKVAGQRRNVRLLEHELETYAKIEPVLGKYLPRYRPALVMTNLGPGLVCEFLHDADKRPSQTLFNHLTSTPPPPAPGLVAQLDDFARLLIRNNIFFYDFNLTNFMVQKTKSGSRLYFTDLKTYNRYRPWVLLHAEKLIRPLARAIMRRRLKRLYRQLGIGGRFPKI